MAKTGRNEPCPCGSGKKYKNCCLAKDEARSYDEQAEEAQGPGPEPAPEPEAGQQKSTESPTRKTAFWETLGKGGRTRQPPGRAGGRQHR